MPPIVHEIDPYPDTVIILRNPCRDFAPWDDAAEVSEPTIGESEDKVHAYESYVGNLHSNIYVDRDKDLGQDQDRIPTEDLEEPVDSPDQLSEPEEIHYLVSSRHLILASPWFRRTLTSEGSKEAVKDPSDGLFHLEPEDWDEEAFLILLNIFHIRTRSVPTTVSLEMLAKFAVLVDFYELAGAEVIERDTSAWIADVRKRIAFPTTYCRDLVLWIFVAQVFKLTEEFEKAVAVAIHESRGPIQTLGLQIREKTTSEIERQRCWGIGKVLSELGRLLEAYGDADYSCPYSSAFSFQCGALLYGALMKEMQRWNFLAPAPTSPFLGMGLEETYNKLRRGETLEWWHRRNENSIGNASIYGPSYEKHKCSLGWEIGTTVKKSREGITGVKLLEVEGNDANA